MEEQDGVKARLDALNNQLEDKASKESVEYIGKNVDRIERGVSDMKVAFRNLQVSILVACVTWALGSVGFIIAILLSRGG